jgi:hypothetical protein
VWCGIFSTLYDEPNDEHGATHDDHDDHGPCCNTAARRNS